MLPVQVEYVHSAHKRWQLLGNTGWGRTEGQGSCLLVRFCLEWPTRSFGPRSLSYFGTSVATLHLQ